MAENPPADMPRLSPHLLYQNVDKAVDWLCSAFAFSERRREKRPDGTAFHAQISCHDAVVLLGNPGPDYRNPKQLGSHCQFNYIYVDDLDAHHAQATAAGARIVVELETADYGDRRYAAEDPEGH